MKTLKKIFAVLTIVFIASCSKNDDTPTPEPNPVAISSMGPTTGAKNTAVVLTGTGFSNNAASNIVTLNGKVCTVNQASTTQLNITIPPKSSSGNITVTVAGNSAQSTTFTYIDTIEVSTFAGSTVGFTNGASASAKFDRPQTVAVDKDGNVYVADLENHKIRKITSTGLVSTFAGSTQGFADGVETSARFSSPGGVAVDINGNVYVADIGNHKIRKITPAGVVTTLAGSISGFADGTGGTAMFDSPNSISVDVNGNAYITEQDRNVIRKVSQTGVVTTIIGIAGGFADGNVASALFRSPNGIAFDVAENLKVADTRNNKIRKITLGGDVSTIAGSTAGFADGVGINAQFNEPYGIVSDKLGNLYISDTSNHKIRKISPSGIVTTIAGGTSGFADGSGTTARFNIPLGIAIDTNGNLFVADQNNHKIRKITID